MKNLFKFSSAIIFISLLSSCALLNNFRAPSEVDYIEGATKIDIKKFLNGDIEGFAIAQDQDGKITGTQTIKMSGKWDANKGVVQQDFIYSDGSKDNRTWLITLNEDGSFSAVGHDVSTPGIGRQAGNTAQMTYALTFVTKDGKKVTKFEDKIYLVDEKSAILISKYKTGFSSSGRLIMSLKKLNKE